jgi:putative transposase
MNRVRRILVRWDKKPEHDRAFRHFAWALIAFRAAELFG